MAIDLKFQKNFPLADVTTFKIGGKARFFLKASSEREILEAMDFARIRDLKVFVLGGGSNVLIADEGFDGLVLQIDIKGISVKEKADGAVNINVAAGEDWDDFVGFCVEKNYAGIECLSGIPGLVGGTPIQNVGAYGQEVSETIESVRVFDRQTQKIEKILSSECGFEYRKSIFNTTVKDRYIVLEVVYSLIKDGLPRLVYADLKSKFEGRIPSLRETRDAVCEIRKNKGMLVRQGGPDAQSAGSFFKNPIVDRVKLNAVEVVMRENGIDSVPHYPINDNSVKIPAAWLIEQSGFAKGYKKGNAGLSTKHTLALTNRGNAFAKEILELKTEIQKKVEKKFGIELIPEPNFIGF